MLHFFHWGTGEKLRGFLQHGEPKGYAKLIRWWFCSVNGTEQAYNLMHRRCFPVILCPPVYASPPRRIDIYRPNRPTRPPLDTRYNGCYRWPGNMETTSSRVWLWHLLSWLYHASSSGRNISLAYDRSIQVSSGEQERGIDDNQRARWRSKLQNGHKKSLRIVLGWQCGNDKAWSTRDFKGGRWIGERGLTTKPEFVIAQPADPYCREIANSIGNPVSIYSYERGIVSISTSTIDGSLQKVVLASQRAQPLYLAPHPVLSGHQGNMPIN